MKRLLQVANLLSVLAALFASYYINARRNSSPSISEISAKYDTLITPAGYAFGIWGLIYFGLLAFAIYQMRDIFSKKYNSSFVTGIGWWFVIANLANAAWVIVFTNNLIGASVLIMLLIFFALLKIVLNTNMERWDAPEAVIALIWWPVSLYFGWINVALIVNIAAWLTSFGWQPTGLSPEICAIVILVFATAIFVTMVWKRNMREYACVGAWGIAAIAVKNWESHPDVAYTAAVMAAFILLNAGVHGYQNRSTAPFVRRLK